MHHVKLHSDQFEAINLGLQSAIVVSELMNDAIEAGDVLKLVEHDPLTGVHSGRWVDVRVTHVHRDQLSLVSFHLDARGAERPYRVTTAGRQLAA